MNQETYTFCYEDFCHDLSSYLKTHEESYKDVSFDHLSHTVNADKLAIVLSKFWYAYTG